MKMVNTTLNGSKQYRFTAYSNVIDLSANSGNGNTTIASSSVALGVGCSADNGRTFDGEISIGRVYNRALSLEEINAQNSTTPTITEKSEDVLLWADFSGLNVDESSKPYDYY